MSVAQLIDQYAAGPAQLRQAVAGMSREQILARPIAGKWSTLELVAHGYSLRRQHRPLALADFHDLDR